MIVRRLTVARLGRHRERRLEFGPGLNVVFGPNESGKTTLGAALVLGLFIKPTTQAARWRALSHWADGQPFCLELVFDYPVGQSYRLWKDFGQGLAELIVPDGRRMTDIDEIHRVLATITGLDSETLFRSTVYIDQAEVEKVEARRVGRALEGVVSGAPDDARAADVLARLEAAIGRLEQGLSRPTGTPGEILQARQEVERLEKELAAARRWEAEREEIRQELTEVTLELDTCQSELKRIRPLIEGWERYTTLIAECRQMKKQRQDVEARLTRLREIDAQLQSLRKRLAELARWDGPEAGQALDNGRAIAETVRRREGEAVQIEARLDELDHLKGATEEVQRARALREEIRRLEQTPSSVVVQGLLAVGILVALVGAGLLLAGMVWGWPLLLAGLGLAGLGGAQDLSRRRRLVTTCGAHRADLEDILRRRRVGSVEDLETQVGRYEQLKRKLQDVQADITTQQATLADLLRTMEVSSLDELAAKVAEVTRVRAELRTGEAEREGVLAGQSPEELEDRYRDLTDQIARLEQAKEEIPPEVRNLGIDGYQAIREQARRYEERRDELVARRERLYGRLEELERRRPESVGDLEEKLERARTRLERLRWRHQVYTVTREAIAEARQAVLISARERLKAGLSAYIPRLTGGRYEQVELELDGERLVLRVWSPEKGDYVPAEEGPLSRATVDQVFFAARLALAELVCGPECRPFLVIDDAFCTYDDGRLAAAAAMLKELARERQVIVLTCQGRCAELLADGGHLIRL